MKRTLLYILGLAPIVLSLYLIFLGQVVVGALLLMVGAWVDFKLMKRKTSV